MSQQKRSAADKGLPPLHKIKILGKIKLSNYKPDESLIRDALGTESIINAANRAGRPLKGIRVI